MVIPTAGSSAKAKKAQEIKEPDIGQSLKINRRCSSLAEAQEVAKAALRNSNMRLIRGSISFMGHPILYSGMNIAVKGFGRWDSVTFAVEEVNHNYSKGGGYTTDVTVRGVLGF
jgi:phage protein D